MKKNLSMILVILLAGIMLSSCSLLPTSQLESIFSNTAETQITSGSIASDGVSQDADTVTISKAEYEKYRMFSDMFEIFDAADKSFFQDFDKEKVVEYAVRGLMAGLDDPYSFYYNPKEYAEMWEDDEGSYTGIGVLISSNMQTNICTISRVFKGSPAEDVGVHRGDILYRVGDDMLVNPSNLQDAVDIMRGKPGTDVVVTFLRNGEELTFTITCREISVNRIESSMIEGNIGYIALYEFAGQCEKEFEQELNYLIAEGAEGIIIDLRDNPGGWVEQARYIADLFMDQGELCYLVYRGGVESHNDYLTRDGKVDTKIVILINENTASSSEILTGALRECADATVVGVNSYGKGIIQGVFPVGSNGAGYQMTIAQYYTPKGEVVHKVGIKPDVEIALPEGDNGMYDFADLDKDVQLKKAVEVMKEKLGK